MNIFQRDLADIKDGGGLRPATYLHFLCYALLIFGFLYMAKQWKDESVGRARAEATEEAEKRVRAESDSRIAANDAQAEKDKAAIRADVKANSTPARAIVEIPKYIEVPTPPKSEPMPDTPGKRQLVFPEEDIVPLYQGLAKCKEDGISLSACAKDQAELRDQVKSAKRETEGWKTAAKGGTKLQKFGRALKVIGCAAGGAALGSVSRQPSLGAPIGAAAGAAMCSIF